jgi:DNA-directed RNA polymerase
MDQRKVNEEMEALGKSRYWNRVNKAKELGLESTTDVGQHLLSNSVGRLEAALVNWIHNAERKPGRRHRAHEYLTQLPPAMIAAITAQAVLDCISQNRKIVSTATQVARLLQDEVQFRFLKDEHPPLWAAANRVLNSGASYSRKSKFLKNSAKNVGVVTPSWDKKDMVQVGLVCIELMREATGIIDIVTRTNILGKSVTLVRPTDDLMQWLKNAHKAGEILKPVYLPMVEPPINWSKPVNGGYGMIFHRNRPLIKHRTKNYMATIESAGMPNVYSAINNLQRTAYRIHEPILDVITHCWEHGIFVEGMPTNGDLLLPTKPLDIDTNLESRRQWRKDAARAHFENERLQSKKLQISKILYLADKFKNTRIWYPRQLDFRGREYPIPYYLQPQGPDISKSLLVFDQSKPIKDDSDAAWLAIHVANTYGNDKLSFADRIKWVRDNDALIRAIGEHPLDVKEWRTADKPLQFLAACMEWGQFRRVGFGFESRLPVSMDATTQGLQIYSLLLRDPVGGMATNCLPREAPNDIYGQVADVVRNKLAASTDPYAAKWLAFGIDRKTTKRQTMTLPYGSTFFSCRNYTTEWFYEQIKKNGKTNPFIDETYKPCAFLATIIWESIAEVVQSARVCMEWLQKIAETCMDNKVSPMWWTPNGFLIDMRYEQTDAINVKTSIGRKIRQHQLRVSNGKLDQRKTKNAIAPNFVHGLDGLGGLLGITVNLAAANNITSIRPTHDEIAVLAADAGMMSACVRQATVELFSQEILENFAAEISTLLPESVQLPPVPPKGTLDIKDVLKSDYYFS